MMINISAVTIRISVMGRRWRDKGDDRLAGKERVAQVTLQGQ